MDNPGLKRHTSSAFVKVTHRRLATPPPMATPHTDTIEGYQTGINDHYGPQRESLEAGPPVMGGNTPGPSATNGAYGADEDLLDLKTVAGASETLIPGETRQKAYPPAMEDLAEEQNQRANQRRITQQKQPGGGAKENKAYDEAQQQVDEKVFERRYRAAAQWDEYEVHPDEVGYLKARDFYDEPLSNRPWEHSSEAEDFDTRVREIMETAQHEGIREPVDVQYGRMHDGAHRWEAARRLGIPLRIRRQGSHVLQVQEYEGEEGNPDHITRSERGMAPIEWVRDLPGARGEQPGQHRNRQGEQWDEFKSVLAAGGEGGIHAPLFITVDHGAQPLLAEGNHRRDAYVELGASHVPVEIRYFGHAEKQGTLGDRVMRRQAFVSSSGKVSTDFLVDTSYQVVTMQHQAELYRSREPDEEFGLNFFRDTDFRPPRQVSGDQNYGDQPMFRVKKTDPEQGAILVPGEYRHGDICERCYLRHGIRVTPDTHFSSQDYDPHEFTPFRRYPNERYSSTNPFLRRLAVQVPHDDPVYPYNPQEHPERDTVDLDNLQTGDDSFRPHHPLVDRVVHRMQGLPDVSRGHPLMERVNEILDEGSEEGADALAGGLNTIFDSMRETEGQSKEERLQAAKDAIDAHVEATSFTHKEHVKRLHDDWEARGGHKTGEPRPVYNFSAKYTKPQQIVPDPANPYPELTSPIHFAGKCEGCGRKLYDSADSSGDPRGALGDHTVGTIDAAEYSPRGDTEGNRRMHGPSALICPDCDNDSERHNRILDRYMGHKAGDPTGDGYWGWPEGADTRDWKARKFIPTTYSRDRKGKWHEPGEKPGECKECDQGITGFHRRQAAFDRQRGEYLYDIDSPTYPWALPPPSISGNTRQPMVEEKHIFDGVNHSVDTLDDAYHHPSWAACAGCLKYDNHSQSPNSLIHQPESRDVRKHQYQPLHDELPPGVRLATHGPKEKKDMAAVLDVQGRDGNWNYSPYMHGMYNGMELMRSIADGDEPEFRDRPGVWLMERTSSNAHPLFKRKATRAETDDEFWARMEREHPGQQNTSPYMQSPDAVAQSFDDIDFDAHDPDTWEEDDYDDVIPERMTLREHAKLLRSAFKWDGSNRYPKYTYELPREVGDGIAHEGHVIEHNTGNRGPALPRDGHEPHVLEYPWSHSYYPAGHTDDQGWAKGYNTMDQAMEAAHKLAIWGPHHPGSTGVLSGYKRIGDDADYNPEMLEGYGR